VRLIISKAGNCTSPFEKIAPGTPVALDGPHGSFMVPKTKGPVVMIAGGVGIAPLFEMLEEAAANSDKRPFRLLYAARKEDALVCTDRLRELQGRLALSITYLVDEPKRAAWCKPGPLTLQHLRELIADVPTTTAVALVYGPSRMMEFAADGLLDAGFPPSSIFYERFDMAPEPAVSTVSDERASFASICGCCCSHGHFQSSAELYGVIDERSRDPSLPIEEDYPFARHLIAAQSDCTGTRSMSSE
jgi:ferredoxin-NADP reductase